MRRILVNHAFAHSAAKRGGGAKPVTSSEHNDQGYEPDVDLAALDDALKALTLLDARQARVVQRPLSNASGPRRASGFVVKC